MRCVICFSCDTVIIEFLMAAMNNLDVLSVDIQNDFIEAPSKEKIFFYARDEWKVDKDKFVIFVKALYSIKSSAVHFYNCSVEILGNQIGHKSSLADPDIWYKPMTDVDGF